MSMAERGPTWLGALRCAPQDSRVARCEEAVETVETDARWRSVGRGPVHHPVCRVQQKTCRRPPRRLDIVEWRRIKWAPWKKREAEDGEKVHGQWSSGASSQGPRGSARRRLWVWGLARVWVRALRQRSPQEVGGLTLDEVEIQAQIDGKGNVGLSGIASAEIAAQGGAQVRLAQEAVAPLS